MDDRHRFRAPPASGIGGKPFPDVFLCLYKKNPHGLWHDTCRSPWGFFLLAFPVNILSRVRGFFSDGGSCFSRYFFHIRDRTFCCSGHAMETLIGSQSPRSLTLYFAGFSCTQKRAAKFLSFAARSSKRIRHLLPPREALQGLSCMAYLLFLLLKYCIAKTPPSTAMPMMSVRMVGSMRQRPPARRRRRSRIFALQ